MKFSQRIGINLTQKILQIESIDEDLRNSLWSLLTLFYWEKFDKKRHSSYGRSDFIKGSNLDSLFKSLWINHFKKPIDTIPIHYFDDKNGLGFLRSYFFEAKWHEIYDFVEFVCHFGPQSSQEKFIENCNIFLERENSGYRFIDKKIIEISSSDEIEEIEEALKAATPFYGVTVHLKSAITLMSNKENPDYRNSIKESISAVESLCKTVSKNEKATLDEALKLIQKNGLLHSALKKAFTLLYGYTSDADGIRHALMSESKLTQTDARFMLISCSAFINYVIASSNA